MPGFLPLAGVHGGGELEAEVSSLSGVAEGSERLDAQYGILNGGENGCCINATTDGLAVSHHSWWLAVTEPNESITSVGHCYQRSEKEPISSPSDVYHTYRSVYLADYFSVLGPAAVFLLRT